MKKKVILFMAAGLVLALIAAYFSIDNKVKKEFISGTVVNEIDVSGMTREDLEKEIQNYSLTVAYRDERGKRAVQVIDGTDFDMTLGKNTAAVSELLQKQDIRQYISREAKSYELDDLIEYDEEKLKTMIEQLDCFDETKFTFPEDAYISDYSKTTGYQIVKETAGNIIDKDKARTQILDAVRGMEQNVDLTEKDCYQTAAVTSEDVILNKILGQLNTYAGAKISYRFGSKNEILDGTTISKWLKVNKKKGKVTLKKKKVEEYVSNLRRKYDTIFTNRKFKTSYGKTVTVVGGDYGWWMNTQKENKELLKLIKAGKQVKRTPEYYQTAQSYDGKDYGDTYVEINLATQHVFLYIKGKKIMETDCVTGNAARGFSTPEGTYSITYTERNATLNGENYSTPVKYWMPFNRNIGLHDADWRSSFGGEIYKYNGSHGCVNLPPDKAQKLFKYAKAGLPVICYSYVPKTSSKKDANKAADTSRQSSVQQNDNTAKKNNSTQSNSSTVKKNNNSTKKNNNTAAKSTTAPNNKNTAKNKKDTKNNKKSDNTQKKNKTVEGQGN